MRLDDVLAALSCNSVELAETWRRRIDDECPLSVIGAVRLNAGQQASEGGEDEAPMR
jgi:hypothetical protein